MKKEDIKLSSEKNIKIFEEKESYQFLAILKEGNIKLAEVKRISKKDKENAEIQNLWQEFNKWINTWTVSLVRYFRPFLKWTRIEHSCRDLRTGKLIKIHKSIHPRDNVDRQYVIRKGEWRGLDRIQNCVNVVIWRLDECTKNSIERRIWVDNKNNEQNISNKKENNYREKIWRKRTIRIFQQTN